MLTALPPALGALGVEGGVPGPAAGRRRGHGRRVPRTGAPT
ncbi:hypothetical protein ACFXGT_03260 [Streptomyces sp. NPDC059352]